MVNREVSNNAVQPPAMSAQEILDKEGFLIFRTHPSTPFKVGEVVVWQSDEFIPRGTKMVCIGYATPQEADSYSMRVHGWHASEVDHHGKFIAE